MYWFIKCLIQYADFSGRARRCEYWWFTIGLWIIFGIMNIFGIHISASDILQFNYKAFSINSLGLIPFLICVFFICPYFAVAVRRLHDINKSAWWLLLNAIPAIGTIWFFLLMCADGTYYDNQWGRNPKIHIIK